MHMPPRLRQSNSVGRDSPKHSKALYSCMTHSEAGRSSPSSHSSRKGSGFLCPADAAIGNVTPPSNKAAARPDPRRSCHELLRANVAPSKEHTQFALSKKEGLKWWPRTGANVAKLPGRVAQAGTAEVRLSFATEKEPEAEWSGPSREAGRGTSEAVDCARSFD